MKKNPELRRIELAEIGKKAGEMMLTAYDSFNNGKIDQDTFKAELKKAYDTTPCTWYDYEEGRIRMFSKKRWDWNFDMAWQEICDRDFNLATKGSNSFLFLLIDERAAMSLSCVL